jgi:hypothetical protein
MPPSGSPRETAKTCGWLHAEAAENAVFVDRAREIPQSMFAMFRLLPTPHNSDGMHRNGGLPL